MARSVNGRDQSGDDPNSSFAAAASSQYDSSAYSFPIDTQLAMNSNYHIPSYQKIGESGATVDPPISHLNDISAGQNGATANLAVDPAMAPPQTPGPVSFADTGARASVDNSSDPAYTPQTGDKRKRSKTSRACDECRRKKIRCDAPTEADGTPKICTNCHKAGATCEFERKPMKRGPSKGYIKELAERVQQVEHAQKQSLRQSLDMGTSIGGYAETFLPDEPLSATRRDSSFVYSRNPFAPAEFLRDRIPSTGAWGPNSAGDHGLRARDSGSLAIAPDQTMPPSGPTPETAKVLTTVKPFWSDFEPPPPSKRQRLDDQYANLEPFKMQTSFLSKYFKYVHPLFALLPDPDAVLRVLGDAAPTFQHAFATAVELLPVFEHGTAINGNHVPNSSESGVDASSKRPGSDLASKAFESYGELADHILTLSHDDPHPRSRNENLTVVWTLLLLAADCETDVKYVHFFRASKSNLLKSSLRLIDHLQKRAPTTSEAGDTDLFNAMVEQAFRCACLQSKLHAMSVGLGLFELSEDNEHDTEVMMGYADLTRESGEAGFLAHSSNTIGLAACLFHEEANSKYAFTVRQMLTRGLFTDVIKHYAPLDLQSPFVQQIKLFLELMMSRHQRGGSHPLFILNRADQLAMSLITDSATTSPLGHFNPLDMHAWSVAAITHCEFLLNTRFEECRTHAADNLDQMRFVLQKKSEAFHKHYGHDGFWTPAETTSNEYKVSHWTDCLVRMIDDAKAKGAAAEQGGSEEAAIVPNFAALMVKGWFRVVYHYALEDPN